MRGGRWRVVLAATLAMLGCSSPSPPSIAPRAGVAGLTGNAGSSAEAVAPEVPQPGPALPPLPRRRTDRCDLQAARSALAQGNLLRAARLADHAIERCPAVKGEAVELRARAATELQAALPAGKTGLALLADARQARARNDHVEGRRLAARAIVALEKETGAKLDVVARHQPNEKLELVSSDGGTLVVRETKPTRDLVRDADTVKLVGVSDLMPRMFVQLPHGTRDIAVSPEGDVFAALDLWGKVHVHRVGASTPLVWRERKDSPDYAEAIAFFADGHRLLVVSNERASRPAAIEVLDVRDGTRTPMKAPKDLHGVDRAHLFPDERSVLLVHGLGDSATRVDFRAGSILGTKPSNQDFDAVAISRTGRVALRSLRGVTIWDGGQRLTELDVSFDGSEHAGMAFSRSGAEIIVSGADLGAVTLQLPSGKQVAKQPVLSRQEVEHHSLEPKALGSAVVHGGRRIFAMDERQMRVVDLADGKETAIALVVGAPPLQTVAGGNAVATGSKVDSLVRVLHPAGLSATSTAKACDRCPLAISHDGTRIARAIHKQLYTFALNDSKPAAAHEMANGVAFATFDFEGRLLVAGYDETAVSVRAFDSESGKTERVASVPISRRANIQLLSPDGQHAVVAEDRSSFVVALAQPDQRHPLEPKAQAFAVSGDGRYLFSEAPGIVRHDLRGRALHDPLDPRCRIRDIRPSHRGDVVLLRCDTELHVVTWSAGQPSAKRIGSAHGLPEIAQRPFRREVALSGHGHLVFDPFEDGGTAILDARDGRRVAMVHDLQAHAAALLEHADGRIQLVGPDTDVLRQELVCRVGPYPIPFDLCEEELADDELLLEVLGSTGG